MEIITNNGELPVRFKDVKVGEVYKSNNMLFLKINNPMDRYRSAIRLTNSYGQQGDYAPYITGNEDLFVDCVYPNAKLILDEQCEGE